MPVCKGVSRRPLEERASESWMKENFTSRIDEGGLGIAADKAAVLAGESPALTRSPFGQVVISNLRGGNKL